MSSPVETPKTSGSSILKRLPRLSTNVWLIIILCLFLIAMLPLAMSYLGQATRQEALRKQVSQLQTQYDAAKAKMAGQASASTESGKLKAEAEAATKLYQEGCDNLISSQILMDLAWKNDISILGMRVSAAKGTILGTDYPALKYNLSLSGQVASFQNFLIAIDKRFPSSQYLNISITPAAVEGNLDTATIGLQILCTAQ